MAKPSCTLTISDIVAIHRKVVEHFGGPSGCEEAFVNEASLEHALTAALFPLFGIDRFPTIFDKTAAIAHAIITGHVFVDGNKRTGLAVCVQMLAVNGFAFDLTKADEDFVVQIAEGGISVEEVAAWLEKKRKSISVTEEAVA